MPRGIVLLALLTLVAGCVQPAPEEDEGGDAAAADGYALACDGLARGNGSWSEPCLAMASPNDSPSKTEIDLAVNPADPRNVVVASKDVDPLASKCVWAVAQVSKDGGSSWTTSYIGGKTAERRPTDPLYGWQCITDPIMAFTADGTLYYSLQAYDHTVEAGELPEPVRGEVFAVGSAIFATRSTDGGLTWDKVVPLHVGDGANVFHDYMRVLVNPKTGTYHTIWNQFTGQAVVPVLVSWDGRSDRGNPPVYIPIPDRVRDSTMSGFAFDADGTLHVLIDAGRDAYFTTSVDDGRTWSAPKRIDALAREPIKRQALGEDAFRTTGAYELVVDTSGGPRHGRIYATIIEQDASDNADIFVSWSDDGGATWSERVLVNGGAHQPGFQWIPRPFVDARGTLHMVYLDSSRSGGNHTWIDATWARSTDGGLTFTHAYLTSAPFDGNLGIHQDGFPFIGDYLGIGGAGDRLAMGFPHCGTGRCEIAVASVRVPDA